MSVLKKLNQHFSQYSFLIQIVLDGYGIGRKDYTNAIFQAQPSYINNLILNFPTTQLKVHGNAVGVDENILGGSEVGHLTMGAGRIISQGITKINTMIKDGSFFASPILNNSLHNAYNTSLHLIGLLSDGGIHSHINHLVSLINTAAKNNIKKCYIHAILDGRDVPIQSALQYTDIINTTIKNILVQYPDYDYRFVSACGREYATMDRAQDWKRIERGWRAHVEGKAPQCFSSIEEGILHFRSKQPSLIDQDIPTFNIIDCQGNTTPMKTGDSLIFFNFRADRALEFSQAITEKEFPHFSRKYHPKIFYTAMTTYDLEKNIPVNSIIKNTSVDNSFGQRISKKNYTQFRLAETHKFPHVTFFFNGGYKTPLNEKNEHYFCIQSESVDTLLKTPQMKAIEVTQKAIELIETKKYRYGLINFANADMIGHTGNFNAVVQTIQCLDSCIAQLCATIKSHNGIAIITADHGNADEMIFFNPVTQKDEINTKHSFNPVPCVLFDYNYNKQYQLKQLHQQDLGLSMIAATNFILLGETPPQDLNESLFVL